MEQRTLGTGGPAVSALGLGCNNFGGRIDFAATRAVVHKALDLGITFFDTSDTYGYRGHVSGPGGDSGGARGRSEEFLGRILGARRNAIVLATKFGMPMDDEGRLRGASRAYIMHAVEASLKRLDTDWIDLYQLHRPDPATPIEETLRALDDLVRQGKVRYIGCSYFTAAELAESRAAAARTGLRPFITCQNEYSLLERRIEHDLVAEIEAEGVGLLPYLPLAGGMLTGKYRRDAPPPEGTRLSYRHGQAGQFLTARNWALVERLERFCAARGRTLLELAFAWLEAHHFVASVIAGATGAAQVEANVRASQWQLTPEEKAEVDRLATP
ncbi:MAG TPA: aldo/keto reductase [Stellaceae bacterium]|nr:aldo/keto reductase [Stellaceae bacterium]